METIIDIFNEAVGDIINNKSQVAKIIVPHLSNLDLTIRNDRKKREELINFIKFIVASNEPITILKNQEEPDFIISWYNEVYGLEIVQIIDEKQKVIFEKNESFVKQIEEHFLNQYGNIEKLINLSLKYEITEIDEKHKRTRVHFKLSQRNCKFKELIIP